MKKIGIMGGSFNPVHIGHLLLAQQALETAVLDEIWLMPTGCSYMKEEGEMLSPSERYRMVCLAVEDNPLFKCDATEIERGGYTYTYETVEELNRKYPEYHFFFIFGSDCLFSLEQWKHPERIFAESSILIAVRGTNVTLEEMQKKRTELVQRYNADITFFPFLQLEISSTDIRQRIREGKSIRYLVTEKVAAYIDEKGFYRDEKE